MRWTTPGRAGLPAWRERVEDGERLIDEAGGKLVGVWVTFGRYDVAEIFDAPDGKTALEIVTMLDQGSAEDTETLRAFTREEAERSGLEPRPTADRGSRAGHSRCLAAPLRQLKSQTFPARLQAVARRPRAISSVRRLPVVQASPVEAILQVERPAPGHLSWPNLRR
jgi:uncharacterized protein with GYD domain